MSRRSELPDEVAERVRRHRARLDGKGLRIERPSGEAESMWDGIAEDVSSVLIVDALPRRETTLREAMERLRDQLRPGAEIRIVQRSRPLEASALRRAADRARRRRVTSEQLCDVPIAIRASGYTIGSIERFEIERDDGSTELWVDVVAIDLDRETAVEN